MSVEKTINRGNLKQRESGIEMLKIFAIGLIVISHVINSLCKENVYIGYNDYIVDLSHATTSISNFFIILMMYFGVLGNSLFFICSAWFLLDSKKCSGKKIMNMLTDIWVISILIMVVMIIILGRESISYKLIIKSIFPTTFANNWYLTAYILFYMIHGLLNKLILGMSQQQLLMSASVLGFLYICCDFIKGDLFFSSILILWVAIYFIIAYLKYYCPKLCENKKVNMILFIVGILGNITIVLLTNMLGLKISFFNDKVLHWKVNYNPFIIMVAVSSFNLARNCHKKNSTINKIAKCSLLIYIIHENLLLRTYIRPYIWKLIYNNFGYSNLFFWTMLFSIILFGVALLLSLFYQKTIQYFTFKLSSIFFELISKVYKYYERFMLKTYR